MPSDSTTVFPNGKGPLPSSLFGYEVVDFVGRGAGSTIYAVSDPDTRQVLALKHVIPGDADYRRDLRFVHQLENELEVSRRFTHKGLRKSFELKMTRSLLRKVTEAALVMEYVDALPIELHLPRQLSRRITIFLRAARALEALHWMNLVHCDLKPGNILAGGEDAVKVIDFGQACPVGTTKKRIQGTPDFIAPEQVRREPVSVRTDVFNFGATLYWALTNGRKVPTLFTLRKQKKQNSFLVDDAIATPREIDAEVPEPLSKLTMQCVKTDPAERPADMSEVARRLETIRHTVRNAEARRAAQPVNA